MASLIAENIGATLSYIMKFIQLFAIILKSNKLIAKYSLVYYTYTEYLIHNFK